MVLPGLQQVNYAAIHADHLHHFSLLFIGEKVWVKFSVNTRGSVCISGHINLLSTVVRGGVLNFEVKNLDSHYLAIILFRH